MLKANYFKSVICNLRISNYKNTQLSHGRRLSSAPGGRASRRGGGASIGRPRGITGARHSLGTGVRFPRTCNCAALPDILLEEGHLKSSEFRFLLPTPLWKVYVLGVNAVLLYSENRGTPLCPGLPGTTNWNTAFPD